MKKLLKFPNALILAGALLALQTSCSKEKTQSSNPKQLKTALARSHDDVVNFKDAYNDWAGGGSYTYSNLSPDDAEWILEAALNYDSRFVVSGDNDTLVAISYQQVENTYMEGNEGEIEPVDLFNAYADMIDLASPLSKRAPMSDVWIVVDGTGFLIHLNVALEDTKYINPFAKKAYSSYHFAVGSIGGPIPSSCPGTTGSDLAWEILDYNLGLDFDPPLSNGYFVDVAQSKTYGANPFSSTSYDGEFTSNTYEYAIYGADQSVYGSSIANGQIDQCLTSTYLSDLESKISILANTEDNGFSAHNMNVRGLPYTSTASWAHHTSQFTMAVFVPL